MFVHSGIMFPSVLRFSNVPSGQYTSNKIEVLWSEWPVLRPVALVEYSLRHSAAYADILPGTLPLHKLQPIMWCDRVVLVRICSVTFSSHEPKAADLLLQSMMVKTTVLIRQMPLVSQASDWLLGTFGLCWWYSLNDRCLRSCVYIERRFVNLIHTCIAAYVTGAGAVVRVLWGLRILLLSATYLRKSFVVTLRCCKCMHTWKGKTNSESATSESLLVNDYYLQNCFFSTRRVIPPILCVLNLARTVHLNETITVRDSFVRCHRLLTSA